jgi:DHA1 family bicyclomycin/chloramphenicol resistance-like MFS transporter
MAISVLSSRLIFRYRVESLARLGLGLNLGSILCLTVLAFTAAGSRWAALPVFVAVSALGLVFGNTTALALDASSSFRGRGSAILGLLQFALPGAIAPLVTLNGRNVFVPLALTMLGASAIANIALAGGSLRAGSPRQPEPHLDVNESANQLRIEV